MWIDLSIWAKDVKIFVFHVNAHQRMTSAEEEFDNQVDRMTHSVDSHPLSPVIPAFPGGPINKVAMGAEMEAMHVFNSMDFHSPSYSCC